MTTAGGGSSMQIQQGEIEMGTYARMVRTGWQRFELVKRDSTLATCRPGPKVYLPGDIHDTRCMKPDPALLFRFTERDLKKEDKEEHRVTRYVARRTASGPSGAP
jgi:hypothetical protein